MIAESEAEMFKKRLCPLCTDLTVRRYDGNKFICDKCNSKWENVIEFEESFTD